jgi:hypothetical protein
VTDWQAFHAGLVRATSDTALALLSNSLGVSVPSLRRVGAARYLSCPSWYPPCDAWSFPMKNPSGDVIGLRVRNDAAEKRSAKGSNNGLFLPEGGLGDECGQVFVCEGPTGLAAMLDMNLESVGRPSCSAYVDETVVLLTGRDVVILADYDEPKKRPDETVFFPGRDGAEALANALHRKASRVRVMFPLAGKDSRDWLHAGASGAVLLAVAGSTGTWKPTKKYIPPAKPKAEADNWEPPPQDVDPEDLSRGDEIVEPW